MLEGVDLDVAPREIVAMIVVTHEMAFARDLSDRVVFMDDGYIVETAPPAKLFTNPDHPRIEALLEKMLYFEERP